MTINPTRPLRFAFFGTPDLAAIVLDELEAAGLRPGIVITAPDKPQGRGMKITPSAVAKWAHAREIEILKPERLRDESMARLERDEWDVFVVAAYGKILSRGFLEMPHRGVLNVHPSLLPKWRGASPIQSQILNDDHETGVSIMLLDEIMAHGPIIAQEKVPMPEWPPRASVLHDTLARTGGRLLAHVLPDWVAGRIEATEQDHDAATFCTKISKEDGRIDLVHGDAYHNLLKIRGLDGWPGAYTYFRRRDASDSNERIRVAILDAHISSDGVLFIDRVKPEGKKEMTYAAFLNSGVEPLPML